MFPQLHSRLGSFPSSLSFKVNDIQFSREFGLVIPLLCIKLERNQYVFLFCLKALYLQEPCVLPPIHRPPLSGQCVQLQIGENEVQAVKSMLCMGHGWTNGWINRWKASHPRSISHTEKLPPKEHCVLGTCLTCQRSHHHHTSQSHCVNGGSVRKLVRITLSESEPDTDPQEFLSLTCQVTGHTI